MNMIATQVLLVLMLTHFSLMNLISTLSLHFVYLYNPKHHNLATKATDDSLHSIKLLMMF